jgi:Ca-activated chloride channel family protein
MKAMTLILSSLLSLIWIGCRAQAEDQKESLVGAGDLIVDGKKPLPLKHTDVKINVTGLVASVQVEQVFTNPHDQRIEAIYTFPLPSDSAVYDMSMQIGDRTIRSLVKRREEAQQIYQQARQSGQQAGLLEQERPNIFTTSVANIDPGDEVRIQIKYIQRLPYDDGGFSLRFPMVVAPRYIPGMPTGKQGAGWAPDTTDVPDASRITPPVLKPDKRPGYNITLSVDIDAGLPIQHLECASHQISLSELGPSRGHVELARKDEIPNKDFVLEYKLAGDQTQTAGLTSKAPDGMGYFMLMAVPPVDYVISDIQPKEITFIIDTSGSMSGPKIEQAKNALRALAHGLNPQDAFNIIRFSSDFSSFSPRPVPFTQENVDRADAYIDRLQAEGGTEMLPPLMTALKQPRDEGRMPLIVFLTDAQVGNEFQILKVIQANLGDTRLYTFGIDTAPNDYLLRKMAELGRGTVEFVQPSQNLEEIIARFQNRIASPVLTNVRIDWKSAAVDGVYPSPIPDLFLARPLVLIGRVSNPGQHPITLRGMSVAGPVTVPLRIDFDHPTADSTTLATLWARGRIETLVDQLSANADDGTLKQQITELAINHKLMSPFTSFVVVEEKVVPSPDGGPPKTVIVPVPLPEGWDYDAVFGERRRDGGGVVAYSAGLLMQQSAAPGAGGGGIAGGVVADRAQSMPAPSAQPSSSAAGWSSGGGRAHEMTREFRVPLATKEDRMQAAARYLVRQQRVDGLWTDQSKKAATADDIQTTAIALLAYLGGGHTDRAGHYQAQVRRALEYLTHSIDSSGALKGLPGSDGQMPAQALALWAMAESYAATHNSRYQAAATKMLTALLQLRTPEGLWPARLGGPPDATTTAWAALALKSCQQAGLAVDREVLAAAARSISSLSQSSLIESGLVQLLAGRSLSPTVQPKLRAELMKYSWAVQSPAQAESAARALILARLLGAQTLNQAEAEALKAISQKQAAQGKEAGSFGLDAGHPVTTSARAYLLLSAGHAEWAALPSAR